MRVCIPGAVNPRWVIKVRVPRYARERERERERERKSRWIWCELRWVHIGGDPSPGEILDYLCYSEHHRETFPIKIQGVSSGYSNMINIQIELDPPLRSSGRGLNQRRNLLWETAYVAECISKTRKVLINLKSTFHWRSFKLILLLI